MMPHIQNVLSYGVCGITAACIHCHTATSAQSVPRPLKDHPCRMFTPETGGILNKVYHFYAYKDLAERETVRQDMMDREKWLRFLQKSRPHLLGPQVPVLCCCTVLDLRPVNALLLPTAPGRWRTCITINDLAKSFYLDRHSLLHSLHHTSVASYIWIVLTCLHTVAAPNIEPR
jgi:hypothetical protein